MDALMVGCLADSWADSAVVRTAVMRVVRMDARWVVRSVDRKVG